MELGTEVVQPPVLVEIFFEFLSKLLCVFGCTETSKVLSGLGCYVNEEFDYYATSSLRANRDI